MALGVDKRVKSEVPVSCRMRDFAVPVFTLVHEGTGMGANGSIIRGTEVGFNIRTGRRAVAASPTWRRSGSTQRRFRSGLMRFSGGVAITPGSR